MASYKALQLGNVVVIALVVILLVLGSIGGFAFYFKNLQITPEPQPTTRQKQPESTPTANKTDTILLYPNIEWIPQSQPKSSLPVVRITNSKTGEGKDIILAGKTWMYEKKGIKTTEEFYQDTTWADILTYYDETLAKNGWQQSFTQDEYTIEAIAGDGDGASMMGYIKQTSGSIQVVSLYSKSTFATGEFPFDAQCPCDSRYEVFISEALPFSTAFTSAQL